jgi:hypothetical protein
MNKHHRLAHRFVRSVPKDLEPGVLYVSMEYATAIHSCCCGCGNQVVTPLTPTDWQMSFDGESVSLSPSIGNWGFPCRSHYIVKKGHVIEAGQWSRTQVEAGRRQDIVNKARFYQSGPATGEEASSCATERKGLLAKLGRWLFGG